MNDYYTNEPANRILFFPENKQNPHRNAEGPYFILNLQVAAVFLKNKTGPKKIGSATKI